LPGLIVAMARPDLEGHLLEATGKKAAFLADVVEQLGLDVTVHHGRAEELSTAPLAESFAIVSARAVAPMVRLVPLVAPYLRKGGQLHAIKGERWREELDAAGAAIRSAGLTLIASPDTLGSPPGAPTVLVLERR
jgi:16S rRNA (guanine527-N7)-methyltransferase